MEEKRLKKSIIYLFYIALMCNIALGANTIDTNKKPATVAKKPATVAKKPATVAKKQTDEKLLFKSNQELQGETLAGLSESIKKENELVLYTEEIKLAETDEKIKVEKTVNTDKKDNKVNKASKNIEDSKIPIEIEMDSVLVVVPNGQPVKGEAKYTSKFGNRRLSAKKTRFHWGIDYGAPIGTEILSTADGIVEFVGNRGAYGKVVIVSHGYGFKTLYAHLSSINVTKGQTINKKDVIAKSGNTGRSTGPHLHYEVHYLNERLDPQNFSEWNTGNYASLFKKVPKIQWDVLVGQIKRDSQVVAKANKANLANNKAKEDSLVAKNNKRVIEVRISKEG